MAVDPSTPSPDAPSCRKGCGGCGADAGGADIAGRCFCCVAAFVVLTLVVLGADLVLKSWSFRHVGPEPVKLTGQPEVDLATLRELEPVVVIPGVLDLKLTLNTGALFGMGSGKQWFFVLVSIIATAAIGVIFYRSPRNPPIRQRFVRVSLALILAGALGNLYDRVFFNAVRDMLYLFPGVELPWGLSWPGSGQREVYPWIFNIADVALVTGVIMMLAIMFFGDRPGPAGETDPG